VLERPLALPDRAGHAVVVDAVVEVGELIGDVEFPVGKRRVHNDDVRIKVQQMGEQAEDLTGDLGQNVEQEVHRRVRGVVGEARAALDRDSLGDPFGAGQLAARFQCAQRDEGEHHPAPRVPSRRRPVATRRIAAPIPVQSNVQAPRRRRESSRRASRRAH
jgi:hypothetical protein